jgi:hypothetical protein
MLKAPARPGSVEDDVVKALALLRKPAQDPRLANAGPAHALRRGALGDVRGDEPLSDETTAGFCKGADPGTDAVKRPGSLRVQHSRRT